MPNYSGVWKLKEVLEYVAAGEWPVTFSNGGDIALFGGSYTTMDFLFFNSGGAGSDFGDLTSARIELASVSSTTRGVFYAGSNQNVIDYVSFSTKGNAVDFGDAVSSTNQLDRCAGCSNTTRGVVGGGEFEGFGQTNVIQYITIASTGNATDFGDLLEGRPEVGSCSSSTRGIFAGGERSGSGGGYRNTIEYITIASTGNSTDFGDMTTDKAGISGTSSSTRGIFFGGRRSGSPYRSEIDFFTIASTGNASNFGTLTTTSYLGSATSNNTIAVRGGGNSGTSLNVVDRITIATTGNAVDFGDLTVARDGLAACSGAHGGLA